MARIQRWPGDKWIRVIRKASGSEQPLMGWMRKAGNNWLFWDGVQTERHYSPLEARAVLVTVRDAEGCPVIEDYERCQELTALLAYNHRD